MKKIEKTLVLDPANVMAVGKVIDDKGIVHLSDLNISFKILGDGCLEDNIMFDGYNNKFKLLDGSTYSVEYLKKCQKIALIFNGSNHLNIFQAYDFKKGKFLKDHPILLRSDNLGFVIAPRIERD